MGQARKRKLRNYLLDNRFQLKYTGMVVAVTVVVAAGLGYVAYDYSRGQTEALAVSIAMQPELNPTAADDLEAFARSEDTKVLAAIVLGVGIMALTLGLTGIVVTHRVVGPAYRMRMLFHQVAAGKRSVSVGIRKGDELQDLFQAFADMLDHIREEEAKAAQELATALAAARAAGASEASLNKLQAIVTEMSDTQE